MISLMINRYLYLVPLVLLGFLVAEVPGIVYGEEVSIQVDGSGSMKGFYKRGGLQKILQEIRKICEEQDIESEVLFFRSNRPDELTWEQGKTYLNPRTSWGNYTKLDRAFVEGHTRAPIIVMITDNIQADRDEDKDTQALYLNFNEKSVKILHAVPLILPFDGNLVNPLRGDADAIPRLRSLNPNAQIRSSKSPFFQYRGDRGFIMYLYLFNDDEDNVKEEGQYREIYNRLIAGIRSNGREAMRLKPIKSAIILSPDAVIHRRESSLDEYNQIRFGFTLQSKLEYINIVSEDIPERRVTFEVKTPQLSPELPKDRVFFGRSRHSGRVTPPTLAGILEKNTQNLFKYKCFVQLEPPLTSYKGFFHKLTLARLHPIPAYYYFSVALNIPPDSFRMTPAYKARYFTDNPAVLDRIHTPVDMIRYLHPQALVLEPENGMVDGQISFNPPLKPWFAWGVLLFLLLVMVTTGIIVWFWPIKYKLDKFDPVTRHLRPFGGNKSLSYENAAGEVIQLGTIFRRRLFSFCLVPEKEVQIMDADSAFLEVEDESEFSEKKRKPIFPEGVLLEKEKIWQIKRHKNSMPFERLGRVNHIE